MINIKQSIYQSLSSDAILASLVGGSIHTWADNKDIRDTSSDIFPLVTYYRESSQRIRNTPGIRTEIFQITAWAYTMANAEEISHAIINLFNRTMNTSWKSCTLISVYDSHDIETKSYGVHTKFAFVIYDPSY